VFEAVIAQIPASWLGGPRSAFASADAERRAYVAWLNARLAALPVILQEAERARALAV
jgi:hypothetical protein